MMNGYDFSHWQTDDTIKMKLPGADFVIHKATEGTTYKDPMLIPRCQWLFENTPGIIYHYLRADKPNLDGEVNNFIGCYEKVKAKGYEVGLAVDVEYSSKTGGTKTSDLEYCKRFVSELIKKTGKRVIIYMPDTYGAEWYKWIREKDLGLWIARYRTKYPEHACDFWQFTSKPIDCDVFYGSEAKLFSFIDGLAD